MVQDNVRTPVVAKSSYRAHLPQLDRVIFTPAIKAEIRIAPVEEAGNDIFKGIRVSDHFVRDMGQPADVIRDMNAVSRADIFAEG